MARTFVICEGRVFVSAGVPWRSICADLSDHAAKRKSACIDSVRNVGEVSCINLFIRGRAGMAAAEGMA